MKEHICFEAIDCKLLRYVGPSKSWFCFAIYDDIKSVDMCMHCKFARMVDKEKRERRKELNGRFL